MTNQEFFNIAFPHLTRPGFMRSVTKLPNGNDCCLYAGPDGNSCGVGCALPRELGERLDALETTDWHGILDSIHESEDPSPAALEAVRLLAGVTKWLLVLMQDCHDDPELTGAERLIRLREIAARYELTIPGES
jgi:hypothetical protein